jgi:N-acetyl-anhydromuramyl-L-alanine amidase AmpD
MRKINKLILHCSDSSWGNALVINQWHLARGWHGRESKISCGYHFIVQNGYPYYLEHQSILDGMIESGRPVKEIGAHVRGHNQNSIGICLIGKPGHFTHKQLGHSLRALFLSLLQEFNLSTADIYGHYEFDSKKTCPGLNMDAFRLYIENGGEAFLRETVELTPM